MRDIEELLRSAPFLFLPGDFVVGGGLPLGPFVLS